MKFVKLGSIISIKKGRKHSITEVSTSASKRLITIEDLRSNSNLKYTDDLKGSEVIPADIIIVWDGANSGLVGNGLEGFIGSTLARLRVKDIKKISSDFLACFLKSQFEYLQKTGAGAAIPHVNRNALENLKIPKIDIDDQTRIATLLSKVESLIAKRKKSIAALDELLKSTFLEMFGDPVRNEMGWDNLPLPKTGKFLSGGTPSKKRHDFWDGDFPWVSPKDMKTNYLMDSKDHISNDVFKETSLKKIEKNNVLIVVRGMILAHSFPVAINRCPVAINQDMKAIKPRKEYNSIFFLSCLIAMERQILSLISSAAHGTRRFDSIAMQKVLVPKPPLNLQNKFANIVEKVEAIKEKYQASLNDLETLYSALSQKAFKGELDLSRIPLTVDLKPKDITAETPQAGEPALIVRDKPDQAPESREEILRQLFKTFLSGAKNTPISLDDFWPEAEEKFMDLLDEDAQPLGVPDYDRVRDWLFDMLAAGSVTQVFNEQENRMEIRAVP